MNVRGRRIALVLGSGRPYVYVPGLSNTAVFMLPMRSPHRSSHSTDSAPSRNRDDPRPFTCAETRPSKKSKNPSANSDALSLPLPSSPRRTFAPTDSPTQPMRSGVFADFKSHYRSLLLRRCIESLNQSPSTRPANRPATTTTNKGSVENPALESDASGRQSSSHADVDLLCAYEYATSAWQRITANTIARGFARCGFAVADSAAAADRGRDVDVDLADAMLTYATASGERVEPWRSYVGVDERLAAYGEDDGDARLRDLGDARLHDIGDARLRDLCISTDGVVEDEVATSATTLAASEGGLRLSDSDPTTRVVPALRKDSNGVAESFDCDKSDVLDMVEYIRDFIVNNSLNCDNMRTSNGNIYQQLDHIKSYIEDLSSTKCHLLK